VAGKLQGHTLFVAEEGYVAVSYHFDLFRIRAGDVLVCLFGIEVPFVLRLFIGTSTHEMLNVAYVPGHGDDILCNGRGLRKRTADWVDIATEGGDEYAIV
jgi:hypothetical protein